MVGALELDGGLVDDVKDECGGTGGDGSESHLRYGTGEGPCKPFIRHCFLFVMLVVVLSMVRRHLVSAGIIVHSPFICDEELENMRRSELGFTT